MNKKVLIMLSVVFLLTVLFSSFSFAQGDEVIIGLANDALYLDPHQQNETTTNMLCAHIFDSLVHYTENLEVIPGLAKEWTRESDTEWVFHLEEGVKFHNGNDFTAEDVKYSVDRVRDTIIANIVSNVQSVEIVDDYTVKIETVKPYAVLLRDLEKVKIVDKDYVEEVGDDTFNREPVGTGPYKLVEWIKSDHIKMEANEDYWGQVPEIETVIFRPITNNATRTAALLSGDVDFINDVPVRDAERIANNSDLDLIKKPSLRLIYLHLDGWRDKSPTIDLPENPLQDIRVRQAIYYGINVDAIVQFTMDGHAYPAEQFVQSSHLGYVEGVERYPYDPEKARELLAEAGYPDGFTVTLDSPNDRYVNDAQVAQAIASQLSKIGINIELNLMPKSLFFDYVRPGDKSSIVMSGWSATSGGAGRMYEVFLVSRDTYEGLGGSNRGHYSNSEFDQAVINASSTASIEERDQYLQKATQIALDDLALIPLYYQEDLLAKKDFIEYTPRVDNYILASEMKLK